MAAPTKQRLAMIPIADLCLSDNIRGDTGDVTSLAESIALLGILEPLVVWPSEDGKRAEVGMGQRRLAAAKEAGLTEVLCVLRDRPAERERILMQLAENHERSDMSPIDKAKAFLQLMDLGISRRAIARSLNISEDGVYRHIRLLDMPRCIQDAVHAGTLNRTTALEFHVSLAGDKAAMRRLERNRHIDDETLRSWIKAEHKARRGTSSEIERAGVRVIAVTIPAYEHAKERARATRKTLTDWATDLILNGHT